MIPLANLCSIQTIVYFSDWYDFSQQYFGCQNQHYQLNLVKTDVWQSLLFLGIFERN